jgi:hypothetical protein
MKRVDEKYERATVAKAERVAEEVRALFDERQIAGLKERFGE